MILSSTQFSFWKTKNMCGIWGVVSKTNNLTVTDVDKILPNLLIAGNLRGTDGAGLFSINKDFSTKISKKAGNSFHLLFSKDFEEHKKDIWINGLAYFGHNRAATKGEIKDKNTHPFETKNIILIHNGTVISGLNEYEKTHDVDSAALAHMIENEGMYETSKNVSMAYALIWYDKRDKTLHFCRNNERPLTIIETSSGYYFVSEPAMMRWILERHSEKIVNEVPVKPLIEYVVDLQNQDIRQHELTTKQYTSYNNYGYQSGSYTPVKPEPKVEDLMKFANKLVTFKIDQKVKIHDNNKNDAFFAYYGKTSTGIDIKFQTKRDLGEEYNKEVYEGYGLSPEKSGNKLYLLIKAKTVKRPKEPAIVNTDDDEDALTILDLGDGNSMTVADFKSKMKYGCAMCNSKLFENNAQFYTESPDSDGIFCDRCSAEFLSDPKAFKDRYVTKKYAH